MVAIDNKSNSGSNLVGVKQNISVDEVDMLFAELFALVNTGNSEGQIENEDNIINIIQSPDNAINSSVTKEINNYRKTEDLAKSLIQIFYKDIGIGQNGEPKSENIDFLQKNIIPSKKSNNESPLKFIQNKKDQVLNQDKQNFSKPNLIEKNVQQEKVSISVSFNPPKKNMKLDSNINLKNDFKKNNIEIESKLPIAKTEKNNSRDFNLQKKPLNISGQVSEKKKISKKKQSSTMIISKEEENQTTKNQASIIQTQNQVKSILQKNIDSNGNISKIKKDKNNQLQENKTRPTRIFTTPETLNLMESSWGEKFSKMVRNAVANGLNKVEITLKPKSLGKINLDISVKDNATKIQINAENQESANLLNENLGKINELIESKNEKISNFFDGGSHNSFNNQKKQRELDNQQIHSKKKSIDNNKTSISNHNIDVQA